jgi:two-component system nitrate/nitrite response regulator NarL
METPPVDSPQALRTLVVEDDDAVREAVASTLKKAAGAISLVAVCGSAREAIAFVESAPVLDVALVDLALGDGSGIDVIRVVRRVFPQAAAVALTVFDDTETVMRAIRAGARGYLLKDTAPERLVASVIDAGRGGAPMTPSVARCVMDDLRVTSPQDAPIALSARELEVLSLLCEGRSYAEIATALGMAIGTVQTHVKSVYGQLEVSSKAEAAAVAFRRGLIG